MLSRIYNRGFVGGQFDELIRWVFIRLAVQNSHFHKSNIKTEIVY